VDVLAALLAAAPRLQCHVILQPNNPARKLDYERECAGLLRHRLTTAPELMALGRRLIVRFMFELLPEVAV
jgi:hypothetical protein